jgi:hypothetical protein
VVGVIADVMNDRFFRFSCVIDGSGCFCLSMVI